MVLNNLMALDAQTLSGPESARGPSAITDVVEHAVALHGRDAERKGIELVNTAGDDALLDVDRETLIAVLDNLLSNAVKFTPEGGRVEVGARVEERTVRVTVSDSGIGLPRLFLERWQRGDSGAAATGTLGERGVGIGLGVVRNLLATFESRLEFEPLEPRGVQVSFKVPRYFAGGVAL
jgi:two-component system cell cycle sensor histidine kinase PleC